MEERKKIPVGVKIHFPNRDIEGRTIEETERDFVITDELVLL